MLFVVLILLPVRLGIMYISSIFSLGRSELFFDHYRSCKIVIKFYGLAVFFFPHIIIHNRSDERPSGGIMWYGSFTLAP